MYRTLLPHVYGYLLALCGGNVALAEDLTSDTFLAASQHAKKGRLAEVSLAWLKTVARRRFVDHVRREVRLERRVDALGVEVLRRRQVDGAPHEDRMAVLETLGALSDEHRMVLVLRHVDGLSLREIASVIDRSEKAVESLLARARKNFRDNHGDEHV